MVEEEKTMPRKPKYINPDQTIEDFYASVSDSYHHPAGGEETGNPARKKGLSFFLCDAPEGDSP